MAARPLRPDTERKEFNPYSIVDDDAAEDNEAPEPAPSTLWPSMDVRKYYGNSLPEFQWISGSLQSARKDGVVLRK